MAGLIAGTTVKRLSTAAQFFTDEEHNEEDEAETAKQSTSEKVKLKLRRKIKAEFCTFSIICHKDIS